MAYIKAAIEYYSDVTIDDINCVFWSLNIADAMKKSTILPDLVQAFEDENLGCEVAQAIKRTKTTAEQENYKAYFGNVDFSTTELKYKTINSTNKTSRKLYCKLIQFKDHWHELHKEWTHYWRDRINISKHPTDVT